MPRRPMTVSEFVDIAVDPATVYAHVSDPTQTARWSPENTGATVSETTASLPVGAVFTGHNKRFGVKWSTRCRVSVAEPERRFQFVVEAIGVRTPRLRGHIATWTYDLVRIDGGTRVIETWDDDRKRWPDPLAAVFDRIVTRSSFPDHNRRNIRTTLDNLRAELER